MRGDLSRRRLISGLAAAGSSAVAAPLLSGCGEDDQGRADELNALLITGGPAYPQYWKNVTTEFRNRTGITVNYELLQFEPITAKEITLSAARSKQYDVYSTHTAQIGAFFQFFEPLNEYFDRDDLKDFYSVALKYLTNPDTGELAAIPRNMDSRTQFYRTDLYDAHGIKPARTWDDLIDNGRELTKGLEYGLVLPGQGDPAQRQFADFLWQAGGDWLDEDNNAIFNSPAGVEALTFYRDLIHRYRVVPREAVTYIWNENSANFTNKTCATVFDWPNAYANFGDPEASQVAESFDAAPLPEHKTAVSCAISHAMAINRLSRKKQAAAEFVKYTVSRSALLSQYRDFTNFPSRQSVAHQVIDEATGSERKWLQGLQTTIRNGKEWPKVPGFDRVSPIVQTAVQSALSGQMTPKQALDGAARESDRILAQAGART